LNYAVSFYRKYGNHKWPTKSTGFGQIALEIFYFYLDLFPSSQAANSFFERFNQNRFL